MAFATFEDVATRFFRPLEEEERELVEARLADAENKIRLRIPDLDERVRDSPEYKQTVIQVCADAVIRLIKNPEGYIQETDGNYTYTRAAGTVSGALSILPEEWTDLGVRKGMRVIHTRVLLPESLRTGGLV